MLKRKEYIGGAIYRAKEPPTHVTIRHVLYKFFPVAAAIKRVITVMVEISKGKERHPSNKSVL